LEGTRHLDQSRSLSGDAFSLCDLRVSHYPLRYNSLGCGFAALGDSLAPLPCFTDGPQLDGRKGRPAILPALCCRRHPRRRRGDL